MRLSSRRNGGGEVVKGKRNGLDTTPFFIFFFSMFLFLCFFAIRRKRFLLWEFMFLLNWNHSLFTLFSQVFPMVPLKLWWDSNSVHPPYLIFMEKSRCLVSLGSNLIQFGSAIVKISHSEGRWYSVEICNTFLGKLIPHNSKGISSSPFYIE